MRSIVLGLLLAFGLAPGAAPAARAGDSPPAPASVPSLEPGEVPRIARIEFPGERGLSARRLRGVMRLRQSVWWKPLQPSGFYGTDFLERDLDRVVALLRDEGFIFARVEEAVVRYLARDRVALEIRLDAGPRVRLSGISVRGADGRLGERLARATTLTRGTPLREVRLQADELRVLAECQEQGLALAAVNREVRFSGDSAQVVLWVDPGPRVRVGEVRVTGVERTRAEFVAREVGIHAGELLRRSKMISAQERLFDLGLFRTVRILPVYADSVIAAAGRADSLLAARPGNPGLASAGADSVLRARDVTELAADLEIAVAEKRPGWVAFGGGVSSEEEVRVVGEWGYRNLFGRAHGLLLRGLVSYALEDDQGRALGRARERRFEVNYTQPSVFGWPFRWQVNPYYRFEREPTFGEDIFGLLLGGHRMIGRFERLVASLENKWISTGDSTAGRSEYQTRFLALSFIDDRRDFPLDPRRGRLLQGRVEYAGGFLGGASSFTRWVASASFYVPLGRRFTWAWRGRGGHIALAGGGVGVAGEPRELLRVPFDERFRAGGGTTVRGYPEKSLGPYTADGQPLGGLALLVLNTEMRFSLFWQLGAAIFLDAGNVWEDYRQITWSRWSHGWSGGAYSDLDAAYSAGLGLRMWTPVGPLRLDYGWKVNEHWRPGSEPGEWHFSLGQAY